MGSPNGLLDIARLPLAALSALFPRYDAAQPVALTQAQKGQLAANSGQAWEQIGNTITLVSAQATIDWTGLSAFRHLRVTFSAAPVTSAEGVAVRVGIGGVYDAAGNYNGQETRTQGATITGILTGAGSSIQLCGGGVGNSLSSRGAHGQFMLHEFNQAYPTVLESHHSYRIAAGTLTDALISGDHFVAAAQDSLRLITNTATGFLAGSAFTLEGIRG